MQHLQPNSTLQGGKYKIISILGQGGFGITYLAEQVMLGRKVALKEFFFKEYCERDEATSHVTLGTQSNAETVQRFLQKFLKEARTISQLDHPHIVKIHDIFEENNTAYYVMDYIEGESLSDIVKKQGALSEVTAVEYIKQVASALGYIHSKSINHLDVKPANIMVRKSDSQAILIDFGLSKQYDEIGSQTSSTPVGISQGYAPIEQYRAGGVSTFSPQTDIYSLGATFYWLVIGKTPPAADEILDEGLPSLPSYTTDEVKNAITSAMQARKKDRPDSVEKWLEVFGNNTPSKDSVGPTIEEEEPVVLENEQIADSNESTMLIDRDIEEDDEEEEEEECGFDIEQYIIPDEYKKDLSNTGKLAHDGDAEAMFALAIMYLRGEEKFQNFDQAHIWLSKCKDKGDERAKCILNKWDETKSGFIQIEEKIKSEALSKTENQIEQRETEAEQIIQGNKRNGNKRIIYILIAIIAFVISLFVFLSPKEVEDYIVDKSVQNKYLDEIILDYEFTPNTTIKIPSKEKMLDFKYTGQIKNGLPTGKGVADFIDGSIYSQYQGNFENGVFSDHSAILRYSNGDVYSGAFVNGFLSVGVLTTAQGLYFVGKFVHNTPCTGIWYSKNEEMLTKWEHGQMVLTNASTGQEQTYQIGNCVFSMKLVKAGTFSMGESQETHPFYNQSKPVHKVIITKDYYIGETEVTQKLWECIMNNNKSSYKGENRPVENIESDYNLFLKQLNRITGNSFRLPSEAEWEFAARGGTKSHNYRYSGSNNINEVAWYMDNSGDKIIHVNSLPDPVFTNNKCRTHDVATKKPNELGLYDMTGNVWELCSDYFFNYEAGETTDPEHKSSDYSQMQICRGGSCVDWDSKCYFTYRYNGRPATKVIGIRLALTK